MSHDVPRHHHVNPFAELNDLRILKLAQMHEQAFSHFLGDIVSPDIQDEEIRMRVARIVPPSDRTHARLAAESARLGKGASSGQTANRERAALLDVLELAEADREFYVRHMDELHDPRTVQLFREIARVQETRAEHVRAALRQADARSSREKRALDEEASLGPLLSEDDLPLREGVSDYGR